MTAAFPFPVASGKPSAPLARQIACDLKARAQHCVRTPWPIVAAGGMSLLLLVPAIIDRPRPHWESVSPAATVAAQHTPLASSTPSVEPLVFDDIDVGAAQRLNAAAPFSALGPDRPAAFHMTGSAADFDRAADCLGSAVLYEAGDDPTAQAAVAQVVLNRMRHPAFPHSVCGVVFQGSERATGCQFTFTCDGALERHPSPAAWQRARATAAAFLHGKTEPAVGMATHYHTDWVHPYWSGSLDKIARVGTHLFFRWKGGWGRQRAFAATYTGTENVEPKLAAFSAAHRDPAVSLEVADAAPQKTTAPGGLSPDLLAAHDGDHFILVDAAGDGGKLAMQGLGECAGQAYCKVVGWDRRAQVYGSPANPLIHSVAFLYVTDKRTGVEVVLWDCVRYNRPSQSQCLSDANRRWISFHGDLSRAS